MNSLWLRPDLLSVMCRPGVQRYMHMHHLGNVFIETTTPPPPPQKKNSCSYLYIQYTIHCSLYAVPPEITVHPQDEVVTVPGAFAEFSCIANGSDPLTFTWWRSTSDGTPIQVVDGIPAVSFSPDGAFVAINDPPPSYNGNAIYCNVANSDGTVMSDTATLTVQSKSTMTVCFTHDSGPAEPVGPVGSDCTRAAKLHYHNLPFFCVKKIVTRILFYNEYLEQQKYVTLPSIDRSPASISG